MTTFVTPEDHGAVGDGNADDSASIAAADAEARSTGRWLQFGARTYRAALTMYRDSDWRGVGTRTGGAYGTVIVSPQGIPAIRLNPAAAVYGARMEALSVNGANAPAVFKDDSHQHDGITITRCALSGTAAIRAVGAVSSVTLRDVTTWGAGYGIDIENPPGYTGVMDWWQIDRCILGGTLGGLRFRAVNAGGHNWTLRNVRFGSSQSHPVWLHAYARCWSWIGVTAAEAMGGGDWNGPGTFTTRATGKQNEATVSLVDVSRIAVGDLLTIRAAEGTGGHWEGTILSLDGNVATLDRVLGRGVTNAECTNARADIIHQGTGADSGGTPWIGGPQMHVFTGCDMGRGAGSNIRFMMASSGHHLFHNVVTYGAPIADVYARNTYVNASPAWQGFIRPNAAEFAVGASRFDPGLGRPLWSDGSVWRDANGTAV